MGKRKRNGQRVTYQDPKTVKNYPEWWIHGATAGDRLWDALWLRQRGYENLAIQSLFSVAKQASDDHDALKARHAEEEKESDDDESLEDVSEAGWGDPEPTWRASHGWE